MPLFLENPELLRPFRAGDPAALGRVYYRYVDDVHQLLRHGFRLESATVPALPDQAALEDLVQETFVRAFGESGRLGYDGLRPYRPYLMRVAKNLRIDQLRRAGRAPLPLDAAELAAEPIQLPEDATPEARSHARQLQEATADYVRELDAQTQRFVRLRFEEEHSQRDVAELMGLTRRRVRTLEQQTLRGLRRFLRERRLR